MSRFELIPDEVECKPLQGIEYLRDKFTDKKVYYKANGKYAGLVSSVCTTEHYYSYIYNGPAPEWAKNKYMVLYNDGGWDYTDSVEPG